MTNFVEQLKLAERAQEDVYFARLDRELIDALHKKELIDRQARLASEQPSARADDPAVNETEQQGGK